MSRGPHSEALLAGGAVAGVDLDLDLDAVRCGAVRCASGAWRRRSHERSRRAPTLVVQPSDFDAVARLVAPVGAD